MNESRYAPHFSGKHRRSGGESSHSENNLRIKSTIDGTATPEAFVKSANKSQDSRRKWGRQTDRREFLERNFRMFLQGERVDILFRYKKQHFMSALAQHFGDSKSRKKMPASSSTCDDGVHEIANVREPRRSSVARIPQSAICNP